MAALRVNYYHKWGLSESLIKGHEDDLEVKDITTVQDGVRRLATSPILPNPTFIILDSIAESDPEGFDPLKLWDRQPLLLSFERVHLDLNSVAELEVPRLPFLDKVRYLSLNRSRWYSTAFIRAPFSLFGVFANLKVLKLQHCGITDHDLSLLVDHQLGLNQLTCLDLRDNLLTDDCIDDLGMFLGHTEREPRTIYPYHIDSMVESVPQYQESATDPEHQRHQRVDRDAETIPDDIDEFIAWATKFRDLDVIPNTGLRQLYLSWNSFSFSVVLSVLSKAQAALRTFDCGASSVTSAHFDIRRWARYLPDEYTKTRRLEGSPYSHMLDRSPIPLAVALCSYHHAPKLEKLRIHHSFVTYVPTTTHPHVLIGHAENTLYSFVSTPNEVHRFLPEVNPNLQCLELVSVPEFAPRELSLRLKWFLTRAAVQERELMVYRLKHPGGRRAPRVLPGLKRLVIVLTNKDEDDPVCITEDEDAERFMRESENDFSFFEGEGRGKKRAAGEEQQRQRKGYVDMRATLAAYRRETREVYEAVKREKGAWYADHHVEEHYHWKGELVVVRPSG